MNPTYSNTIVPFNAQSAVEMVKQLRLAVDILRSSGELVPGVDFGKIPGTGDKDTLLLPGMEKLCRALSAVPDYIERYVERDYDKPLFHYEYECRLIDADTGLAIPGGRGLGLCTSRESSFSWRFVQAHEIPYGLDVTTLQKQGGRTSEFEFAINKAETSGKYGKPAEYWQAFKNAIAAGTAIQGERETSRGMSPTWEIDTTVYRIPNPAIFDQINAIMKRAKKRALGDAIKGAANVSAYFTVDLEDFIPGTVVEGTATVVTVKPASTTSGHEPDSVRVEQSSAKVVGVSPRPTPQRREVTVIDDGFHDPVALNEPDNGASNEPDPLAEFGTDADVMDEDPNLYHCDRLTITKTKTATIYALGIVGTSRAVMVNDMTFLEPLQIDGTPVLELDAGRNGKTYPLDPSWSVYAMYDKKGWMIERIVTGVPLEGVSE